MNIGENIGEKIKNSLQILELYCKMSITEEWIEMREHIKPP